MRNRIDITEVETRTKIRAKYLRAIENEEWDLLPGPVYIKSFLRTYGDYLGLDSRMLIDDYKRRYERPSDSELRPIAALSRDRERAVRGPLLPPWAIIGAVLVVLVVTLYVVGNANKTTSNAQPQTGATVKSRPGSGSQTRPHHAAAPRPAPVVATTAKLSLVPTGQVYVCLVDGTGRKLIPGTIYNVGQTIPVSVAPKLLLTLGNASVRMSVNGRTVNVAPSAAAIRYLVGPTSERLIPLSARPTCP
jgi:cytoskeletal protein RodZ